MLTTSRIGAGKGELVIARTPTPALSREGERGRYPSPVYGRRWPEGPDEGRASLVVAGLAARGPAGVLFGVGFGRLVDQRLDLRCVRADEVADLRPFRAVPLLHEGRRMAVVVGASRLERNRETIEADRLEAGGVDVEIFEAPAHVLAGHDLLAGDLLRLGDGFGDQHRIVDAAIVEHLAELVLRRLALARVDDLLLDVRQGGEVRPRAVPVEHLEALGAVAGRGGVRVVRPPDRDELVHRKFRLDRFLDRGRVHGAPAVEDKDVGFVATDIEPLGRLVLHIRRRHRIELEVEADLLGERLEHRDRLAAVAGVEVEIADRLALQRIDRAAAGVFEDLGKAVPIGGGRVEDPGKDIAFGGRREAVGHRKDRNLVDLGLRDQRQRDAGRPWIDDHRVLRLHRIVALEALLGVVAGLALVDDELDAADASVALVEHRQVVMHTVGDRRARSRKGAGAVGEERHVDRVFGDGRDRQREAQGQRADRALEQGHRFHFVSSYRFSGASSVWERPDAQFLLRGLPQSRQAVRLGDQEYDNQNAGDHEGQLVNSRRVDREADHRGQGAQRNREEMDDCGAEKGADDRAETPDDNHEQNLEREVDIEGFRLRRAEP